MAAGLFQQLTLGASALQTQQIILQTSGNNISNATTPGFSRQRADVFTNFSVRFGNLIVGTGSRVEDITRIRNEFLEAQFLREIGELENLNIRREFITQVEDLLQEPGDLGLGAALALFFGSIQDVATTPENGSARVELRDNALALVNVLTSTFDSVDRLRDNLNVQVQGATARVNELTAQIADLNLRIAPLQSAGPNPNDLQDRRDQLVRELAELTSAQVTLNDNGTVNVFLDGFALVQEFTANRLLTRVDPTLDPNRPDLVVVVTEIDGRVVNVTEGRIGGLLDLRDNVLTQTVLSSLNTLALELTENVNRVHLQGIGLDRFTSETSAYSVDDTTIALDSVTGLPFSMQTGAFFITVYDGNGDFVEQREILVDPTVDSLDDLAANINTEFASGNIVATVNADNTLSIDATGLGNTFTFIGDDTAAADTSDVLLALGFNQFFAVDPSTDAARLFDVDAALQANVSRIAAARTTSVGDNQNAIALAQLRDAQVVPTGGVPTTFEEFFEETVVRVGIASSDIQTRQLSQASFVVSLENRILSISGVSLDEEAVTLIQAQQAFAAAARFIAAVSAVLEILTTEVG